MKLMNSDTHSWTVSLESFAILAFAGNARFIIRLHCLFVSAASRAQTNKLPPDVCDGQVSVLVPPGARVTLLWTCIRLEQRRGIKCQRRVLCGQGVQRTIAARPQ
jgi:hypothetical protein